MKKFYINLVLKSREIYFDHHLNTPGFFYFAVTFLLNVNPVYKKSIFNSNSCIYGFLFNIFQVLTDEYEKAFNRVVNFIYELYTNHSTDKPKYCAELDHFSNVAIPAMINTVVDEIDE